MLFSQIPSALVEVQIVLKLQNMNSYPEKVTKTNKYSYHI